MSKDMSMFKKMKDRISDEVNSATNKLQNMQIIDQLASTINQQIKNELVAPNLTLPEQKFSLIDHSLGPNSGSNDNEELNSDTSPRHQLFNKHDIAHHEMNNTLLANQITALKIELDETKQQLLQATNSQHDSLISVSTSVSEVDKTSSVGSPQPTSKAVAKVKDLEKLLAKCKESLKIKNARINTLETKLTDVERFRELNQSLRDELNELRAAHETWTVSIAENKRAMHQEFENKNNEMEKLKIEIIDLQSKLVDGNGKIRQLKLAIQDLESRLVSTSAAHQKERESLTKELTQSKNLAIKQLQTEHVNNIERVKLDLEKSIEALKVELLHKDEQIIRSASQQQLTLNKNQELSKEIEEYKEKLEEQSKLIEISKMQHSEMAEKYSKLESELNDAKEKCNQNDDLKSKNEQLLKDVERNSELQSKSQDAIVPDSTQFEYLKNIGKCSLIN